MNFFLHTASHLDQPNTGEEIIVAQQREVDKSRAKNKGNGLTAPTADLSATETERLRQVTEEKKGVL